MNWEIISERYDLTKYAKTLKIITYIDCALLIPHIIIVALLLMMPSIDEVGNERMVNWWTATGPFMLTRVWAIILVLRIADSFRHQGIKRLGALDVFLKFINWLDESPVAQICDAWIPVWGTIKEIPKTVFYLIFYLPVLGTSLVYFVHRRAVAVIESGESQ